MTKKTMFILGLLSIMGIQSISAMNESYPITFNNLSDAILIINGGMSFGGPTSNLQVNNVQSVVLKAGDRSLIKEFNDHELATAQTINITKDADTGEYLIETEPKAKTAEVTFNNYPNDTEVFINSGAARITPTRINVTIKGITDALIQKVDETFIRLFTSDDLQDVRVINITKDPDTGKYSVDTE